MAIFGGGDGGGGQQEKNKRTAERRPARVEPKSFFANERTYIQWLNTGMTLLTIASFMLIFTDGQGTLGVGVTLIVVSLIISGYAFYTYFRRLKLLQIRAGSGYIDHFMPVIVSISLVVSMIILLTYFGKEYAKQKQGPEPSYSGTVVYENPTEGCYKHPTSGVKSISYSPNGIYNDNVRGILLIPSIDKVTALNVKSPETPVQTLLTIPGAKLGGLTLASENRIFAVSDGATGEQPILYELAWGEAATNSTNTSTSSNTSSSEKMRVINSWTLETTSSNSALTRNVASGIAFVPSNEFDSLPPSLLVTGDNFDGTTNTMETRGQVFVYELPPPPPTPSVIWNGSSVAIFALEEEEDEDGGDDDEEEMVSLDKTGALNANLINGGLMDSKIGDLYFFESILYILNDNARVIRAWSREGGTLLATNTLPRVGEGFDDNWSGLAIERPNSTTTSNLRGGPGAPLLVHLSLDSPPQVWTFNATQGSVNGSIIFPACASAF